LNLPALTVRPVRLSVLPDRSGTVGRRPTQPFQIWQEKTKKRPLASLKKELWSVNFAKKSKKTPKNELRQSPIYSDSVIIDAIFFVYLSLERESVGYP
jgi:hypothetical protein